MNKKMLKSIIQKGGYIFADDMLDALITLSKTEKYSVKDENEDFLYIESESFGLVADKGLLNKTGGRENFSIYDSNKNVIHSEVYTNMPYFINLINSPIPGIWPYKTVLELFNLAREQKTIDYESEHRMQLENISTKRAIERIEKSIESIPEPYIKNYLKVRKDVIESFSKIVNDDMNYFNGIDYLSNDLHSEKNILSYQLKKAPLGGAFYSVAEADALTNNLIRQLATELFNKETLGNYGWNQDTVIDKAQEYLAKAREKDPWNNIGGNKREGSSTMVNNNQAKKGSTLVINFFAGPGAGKTTCAWEIASKLKKLNINTEYVSEYAKELVWEEKFDLLSNQEHVTKTQYDRLNRLRGKVDVIVTDSPLLLGMYYGKENGMDPKFNKDILQYFNSFENFNLWIKRGERYEQNGRLQNKDEASKIDGELLTILKDNKVYYGTYNHKTLDVIVGNIVTTLSRVNPSSLKDLPVRHEKSINEGSALPNKKSKQNIAE